MRERERQRGSQKESNKSKGREKFTKCSFKETKNNNRPHEWAEKMDMRRMMKDEEYCKRKFY